MIAKCQCQSCDGEIEFDAADFDFSSENDIRRFGQTVPCPHCGMDTAIYLTKEIPAPIAPPAAPQARLNEIRKSSIPPQNQQDTMEGRAWYYSQNGKRIGPRNENQVRTLIATNVIQPNSSVWSEGMADWTPAYQTEIKRFFASIPPPPLTGESVNNGAVWTLAFAPIISAGIQILAAASTGQSAHHFWWIAIVLNIGLCFADVIYLNRAGYKDFAGWIVLIPIYLFVRAARLKQSNGYAIVWLLTFFVSVFLLSSVDFSGEMLNPVSPQVDNSSQISSPASPVVAASQPAAPVPKVSISNVQGEIQDDGGMDITGIIQNLSDTSLNGVTVNFSYFDDDGNKVDDAMDFIQTLAPDDTWSFKVSSLKDSCKKYRLDSITSFIDNSEVNLDVQQTQ